MSLDLTREQAIDRLEKMLLIRRFEERAAELYTLGKIRGFLHLYIGEEAVGVGAMSALRDEDNVVASYREHGQALLRGVPPGAVMAEMFGKANGCAHGRGGSMHLFDVTRRFYGGHAIVGGGLPIAVGLALADKLKGRSAVTACFFGDGAAEEGEFAESLNLAALWKLPVLFVCENNLYAMGTGIERHAANPDLSVRPIAYGIPAERVDGMDVVAVERAVRFSAELVREGGGPRFVECHTYRFRAHSMYDAEKYRAKDEVEVWKHRDPIETFRARAIEARLVDDAGVAAIDAAAKARVEAAIAEAEAGGLESENDLERDVYARVIV